MLLTREEIAALGFARVGEDVRITRFALFFNPSRITIGSRTRIDAFAIITAGDAGVEIGENVHLGTQSLINGTGGKVTLEDFANLAPNVSLWTTSDDYTGGSLTGGTVPSRFKQNTTGPVTLGRHVIVGAGSVILPGVHLDFGSAVGALSLVKNSVVAGDVVCGCPARKIKTRSIDELCRLEAEYRVSLVAEATQP